MARKRPFKVTTAGVNFDPAVIDYLEHLCAREDRSRSFMVNQIVREHAQRNGTPIPLRVTESGRQPPE